MYEYINIYVIDFLLTTTVFPFVLMLIDGTCLHIYFQVMIMITAEFEIFTVSYNHHLKLNPVDLLLAELLIMSKAKGLCSCSVLTACTASISYQTLHPLPLPSKRSNCRCLNPTNVSSVLINLYCSMERLSLALKNSFLIKTSA